MTISWHDRHWIFSKHNTHWNGTEYSLHMSPHIQLAWNWIFINWHGNTIFFLANSPLPLNDLFVPGHGFLFWRWHGATPGGTRVRPSDAGLYDFSLELWNIFLDHTQTDSRQWPTGYLFLHLVRLSDYTMLSQSNVSTTSSSAATGWTTTDGAGMGCICWGETAGWCILGLMWGDIPSEPPLLLGLSMLDSRVEFDKLLWWLLL